MAPLCMLYFIAVASCLGAAAHLADRALAPAAPRRWLWIAALVGAVFLPPIFSAQHSSHVIDLWGREIVRVPSVDASSTAAQSIMNRNWLECSAAYGRAMLALWFAATAVLVLWGIAAAIRVALIVHRSRAGGGPNRSAVIDGVGVLVTDALGPATTGLVRGRVLVPRWVLALPVAQRRYVVRHEDEHRRSHDAALLCVASLLVALMSWNLPLWWMLRRLQLAVEMDCDRRVVNALGGSRGYAELLLAVAERTSRGPRLQPALLGGVGMLERRLTALVASPARGIADRTVAPLVAALLLALVFSVPHPQPASHAQAHHHRPAPSAPRIAMSAENR